MYFVDSKWNNLRGTAVYNCPKSNRISCYPPIDSYRSIYLSRFLIDFLWLPLAPSLLRIFRVRACGTHLSGCMLTNGQMRRGQCIPDGERPSDLSLSRLLTLSPLAFSFRLSPACKQANQPPYFGIPAGKLYCIENGKKNNKLRVYAVDLSGISSPTEEILQLSPRPTSSD